MDEKKITMPIAPAAEKPPLTSVTMEAIQQPTVPAAPNDLYRRLLPAALFLLTFVTVMTMLLMYMDTTALRVQQFRKNMTQDYDLQRITQDDPALVAYVRQIQLGSMVTTKRKQEIVMMQEPTDDRSKALIAATGNKSGGTFVEILVGGARESATLYLQSARGWRGLTVRADPRDYFELRADETERVRALHACLSPVTHPKEVTYYEEGSWQHGVFVSALGTDGSGFSSRVLCYPLYTLLLVGNATRCDYLLLPAHARQALETLPATARPQLIEVRTPAGEDRHNTTRLLKQRGYLIKAEYDDAILYERTPEPGASRV